MRKVRRFKIMCILAAVVFIFSGCSSENGKDDYPFVDYPEETGGEDSASDAEKISEYMVVIPKNASSPLIDAATSLSHKIKEKTGISSYTVYDGENIDKKSGAHLVLVGNTDIGESRAVLFGMRADDYICKAADGVTVIGGKSDSATLAAISRFESEILAVSTDSYLVPPEGGFSYFGEYDVKELKLNGALLNAYAITVDDLNDVELLKNVYALQKRIADKTGYWLDVMTVSENGEMGMTIRVKRDQNAKEKGIISVSGSGVELSSATNYGLSRVCEKFFGLLTAEVGNGGASAICNIDSEIVEDYGRLDVTISSIIVNGQTDANSFDNIAKALTAVGRYSPDVLLYYGNTEGMLTERGYSAAGEGSIYVSKGVSAEQLFKNEKGGIVTEGYLIRRGVCVYTVVYTTGLASADADISIPENKIDKNIPLIVISHTTNCKATLGGAESYGLLKTAEESYIYNTKKSYFSIYENTGAYRSTVKNADNALGYREITLSVK